MFVASEEATSGSVMENADRIRPSSSGSSQRAFCSGVPNSDSSSMFPVSGAEQLSASGAIHGLRPVISASGAYCRLVSPAPLLVDRRQEQVPQAALARLRLELLDHGRRAPRLPADRSTSSRKRGSAG